MGLYEERMMRRLAEMNQAIENQLPVIGFDFGNSNSFLCFIAHGDMRNGRLGGNVRPLLPARYKNGIPSVFFYSGSERCKSEAQRNKKPLPWCGADAVKMSATPYKNRKKLLKRHLGQSFTCDDRTFTYDEAIVKVVEHCVRTANKQLQETMMVTTNLVSLSYPATYSCAQRERLIELVEQATLEDGTHVKVFGTIQEPAAAALDYLSDCAKSDADSTVLTFDLGGGTFDVALVAAYPKGRRNASGALYYYDIVDTDGIAKLGGAEFDEVMYQLLMKKIGRALNEEQQSRVRNLAESVKIELSEDEISWPQLDGIIEDEIEITRAEFEKAADKLIQQAVTKTKDFMATHPNQKPDMILLTGGASQMPAIKKAVEAAFPQYKGKIQIFRPSEAIACGAARYGTVEMTMDPTDPTVTGKGGGGIIQKRVAYDIGTNCMGENGKEYVSVLIPAGTPIPYKGTNRKFKLHGISRTVAYDIYEAKKKNADVNKMSEDYTKIMDVDLDYGETRQPGAPSECRVSVDALGQLTIEAWDTTKENPVPIVSRVKLQVENGG